MYSQVGKSSEFTGEKYRSILTINSGRINQRGPGEVLVKFAQSLPLLQACPQTLSHYGLGGRKVHFILSKRLKEVHSLPKETSPRVSYSIAVPLSCYLGALNMLIKALVAKLLEVCIIIV